jgi:chromosomal replication initiation ATPase DnaA
MPHYVDPIQQRIIDAVCSVTGTAEDDLLSRRRDRITADARMLAYLLMRETGYALADIGLVFDRDHTTVLSGARRARGLLARRPIVRMWLGQAREALRP